MDGSNGHAQVWRAAIGDVPAMVDVAVSRYGAMLEDVSGTRNWLIGNLGNADVLMLCSPAAYMITGIFRPFYAPKSPQAVALFIAGAKDKPKEAAWHTAMMLQETIYWATKKGAVVLKIDSETDVDLAPLVKRITGAQGVKIVPGYTISLGETA